MLRSLRATAGPFAGSIFVLHRRVTTIGRSRECQIQILDPRVSGRHAQLSFKDGRDTVLQDLSSSNGTLLGGARLDRPTALRAGQSIGISGSTFVYEEYEEGTTSEYGQALALRLLPSAREGTSGAATNATVVINSFPERETPADREIDRSPASSVDLVTVRVLSDPQAKPIAIGAS